MPSRRVGSLVVLALLAPIGAIGCSNGVSDLVGDSTPSPSAAPSEPVTLVWSTIFDPYPGGQKQIAKECARASQGRYSVQIDLLPAGGKDRRSYLESDITGGTPPDLMSVDQDFLDDFVEAGYLAPLPATDRTRLEDAILAGSLTANSVDGRVVAFPLFNTTQVLWYRKSAAKQGGLDLSRPVTWDQVIAAAESARTTVQVEGKAAAGYERWLTALIEGAGGSPLRPDSKPGRAAAGVVRRLAASSAADPNLDSTTVIGMQERFVAGDAGFMVNLPFVWDELGTATWKRSDLGWAAYPRTIPARPSRPPISAIGLAISAASEHRELAFEAARCVTSRQHQIDHMLSQGHFLSGLAAVYDDRRVRRAFPMAAALRESLRTGAPFPAVVNDKEVRSALERTFWPPDQVDPQTTPQAAQRAVDAALR